MPAFRIRTLLFSLIFSLLMTDAAKAQMVIGLNTDSLRQLLNAMPADTSKVLAFIRLGQQYENSRPDSAIYFYKQAGSLSSSLNYPAGIVHYINNYTAVLNVQGKFDESLKLCLEAVDICRQQGMKQQYVKSLINVGAVYQYKENYDSAASYYLKSLPLLESANDRQALSLVYGNLCGLYRNLSQPEKAAGYARKALQYAEAVKNPYTIARACINLGNALKDMNKTSEAIPYISRARKIGAELNDVDMQETALINLGDLYTKTNDPDKYIPVFQSALPLAETLNDVYGKSLALQGIAEGLYHKKQFRQAETKTAEALAFTRQHDQKEALSNLLMLMSDIQIALGDTRSSQYYRGQHDSVQNALMNESLLKNVQELETRYEVEKKQHEIFKKNLLLEEKNRESRRQRYWLIASASGILLLSLILFLTYRFYRQKQQLDRKKIEALHAEQENIRLKAILEGELRERRRISQEMHDDMGSGLTSMLFLSRSIEGADEATGKIKNTAESLIRKMNEIIWAMNYEQDSLDSLIAYIRINAAETLDNAGIHYRFQVSDPIPDLYVNQQFRRHIYLTVKEAVHNIIKHAAATEVNIDILTGRELEIAIQDNGKGFGHNRQRRFGNGIKNMEERIRDLNGRFELVAEKGTLVRLSIPLPVTI